MNTTCFASLYHGIIKCHQAWLIASPHWRLYLKMLNMLPDEIMMETFLSSADIAAIRHSWGLAKEAAPFEVHGPAFYHL